MNKLDIDITQPFEQAFQNMSFLIYDITDPDLAGRKSFSLKEKYGIDHREYLGAWEEFEHKMYDLDLDKCDISPIYICAGVYGDDIIYAKIDRAVYQDDTGDISEAVWFDTGIFRQIEGKEGYYPSDQTEYFSQSEILDLEYIEKSLTDDVMPLGDELSNPLVEGNLKFDKIVGYRKFYLPAGLEDDTLYCYALYQGNCMCVRESGTETVYGTVVLTTVDGAPLLQKFSK